MNDNYEICIMILMIFLLICYIINLVLSAIQLSNKGGYGYDGILSMLDLYPILLETNQYACNKYISDIKYKKKFAKIKTIYVIIYNSGLIIYNSVRLKPLNERCFIDIFFCIIIFIGYICELVLVSMSLDYYNKTEYDSEIFEKCNKIYNDFIISEEIFDEANTVSKWVIKADKGIISSLRIYLLPLIVSMIYIIDCKEDKCINEEFCWICICLSECCSEVCKSCSGSCNCCDDCCNKCGICCAKCCGNDENSLKEKNDNLKIKIKELEKEKETLKKENNRIEKIMMTERDYLKDDINIIKDKNGKKLPLIKSDKINLVNEIKNLRKNNTDLSVKEKQIEAIEFYLRKEKGNEFNNNDKSSLKIMLLKEIYKKYGLFLDSNKFKEIALYYLESKLNKHLRDSNNLNLFSYPIILKEGNTLEGENNILTKDVVENKLVAKICEILRKNKGKLKMEDINIIKQLLKDEKTGNYYINPIVMPNGTNKGETIEGNDDNDNYKNIVIKNIISDMKELMEEDFFKYEGLKLEDIKTFVDIKDIMVINFISSDGMINQGISCFKTDIFAEIEEKLYKIYDKYRESNNVFMHGGDQIRRFKTIEENKIKDGDKIIMQMFDE